MIEVLVRHVGSDQLLAKITIENIDIYGENDELGDYSVRVGVEKGTAMGIHQRGFTGFPRTKYNVLALLLQALQSLDPEELEFHGQWDERKPIRRSILGRFGF